MNLFIPITNRLSIQALPEPCSRRFEKCLAPPIPVSVHFAPHFSSPGTRTQLNTVVQILRPTCFGTDDACSIDRWIDSCGTWRCVCASYVCVCLYVCTSSYRVAPVTRPPTWLATCSCLLPDLARGLLQAVVALLVCPAGAEARAHDGRPRPALEQEDREDDAEAEAEGGLDQEVREAAVPLLAR